jgi:phage terminase small subunit
MSKHPIPPKDLRAPTAAWFRSVVEGYAMEGHHLKLLLAACRFWDRALQAQETLQTTGLSYTDRFGAPRLRPEVSVERESLNSFRAMVHELGLDSEPAPTGPLRANSRHVKHYGTA